MCEEWGLALALAAIAVYIGFVVFAIRASAAAGSSLYVIAGIGAASLLLFQAGLNIFGVTDLVPLTGITLPFISKGGSSMAACWGLLGFLAALDDSRKRENARTKDFVVNIPGLEEEFYTAKKRRAKTKPASKKKTASKTAR